MVGLMAVASRKTTNSRPSLDTSVTYLLLQTSLPLAAIFAGKDELVWGVRKLNRGQD